MTLRFIDFIKDNRKLRKSDRYEPFGSKSFDPESFNPELMTEGLGIEWLTAEGHLSIGFSQFAVVLFKIDKA